MMCPVMLRLRPWLRGRSICTRLRKHDHRPPHAQHGHCSMGSKTTKAKHTASAETKAVTIPRIPQEIIDEILDHLAADPRLRPLGLQPCALVSKSWVPSCRRHLFYAIFFTPGDILRWLNTFPVPEECPAHHVRDLMFSLKGYYTAPQRFFEYVPWFENVERVTLLEHEGFWPPETLSPGRLPQSATSLTIDADAATLLQIRDIMVQLPYLNDLSLSGFPAKVEGKTLQGMGATLGGRFRGKLRLLKGHANEDTINMLLEIPTGLHFAEVDICGTQMYLLSAVRLAEACGKTLVKLSYVTPTYGEYHPFSWHSWFLHASAIADVTCR